MTNKIPLYDDEDLKATVDDWQIFNDVLLKYRAETILLAIKNRPRGATAHTEQYGSVLDVGCGAGEITQILKSAGYDVLGIDPDEEKIRQARGNYGHEIDFWPYDIESLPNSKVYETVVCSHVIEHSENPYNFLKLCHKHLIGRGFIIVTCPNALSLHKRIGNILDLSELYGISATDKRQDHKHTFDREMLRALLVATGFDVIEEQGLMLKPFTSAAMAKYLDPRYFDAFFLVGKDEALIDYCSSILIVGQKK